MLCFAFWIEIVIPKKSNWRGLVNALRFSYNQSLMFKNNTQPPYAKFVLESLRKTVHNIIHDPNHIQTL